MNPNPVTRSLSRCLYNRIGTQWPHIKQPRWLFRPFSSSQRRTANDDQPPTIETSTTQPPPPTQPAADPTAESPTVAEPTVTPTSSDTADLPANPTSATDSSAGTSSPTSDSSITYAAATNSNTAALDPYIGDLLKQLRHTVGGVPVPETAASIIGPGPGEEGKDFGSGTSGAGVPVDKYKPYKFSVYASKQNTHITVCRPDGSAIVSMSAGNLGFRKSQRKKYDSAYQLTAIVLDKLQREGWGETINNMELTLRGFGQGREAVSKALTGYEGQFLKEKWVRISDATRVKFGGTRSRNPRRLG